ncbi:hypothetical protein [Streptomyces sp. cg35]|uniref:hypothetical protein n=1 Tax=Streptomyces sp. cg35 TaxID=3421650 RepID=UPI003D16E163
MSTTREHQTMTTLAGHPVRATYEGETLAFGEVLNRYGQTIGLIQPCGNGSVMCASAAAGWDEVDAESTDAALRRIGDVARLIGLDSAQTYDETAKLRAHYSAQRDELKATYEAARIHLRDVYSVRVP